MDILIFCHEVGFRRNVNLNALEREVGTSTITFADVLRHLTASSPSLRTLTRTNELVFHYINQDGRLVSLRAGDSVRRYASYQTFFLESVGSRAVTSIPSYPNRPQQSPMRSRAPTKAGIWITGLVALVLVLSVCVISSHLGSTTTPAENDTSVTTSIPDTPTPSPTEPPISNSYPVLASSYHGTVNNTTFGVAATLDLTSIVENQEEISGNVIIGSGLNGSGTFTGTIGSNGSVSFTDTTTDGSPDINFSGSWNADGSLSGTYTAPSVGQDGTWQVTPSS